jgi:predicted ATPase
MHLKKVTLLPEKYPTREHYPFNLKVLHQTPSLSFHSRVTFFVGENGTGKSTLLEALAHKCGIHIWRGMERTRFKYNPYERQLHKFIAVEWDSDRVPGSFFSSQIFINFAELLDEWAASDPAVLGYFGGESLLTQSHGQSLMSFFKARFQIKGLYLLDEPETGLSPGSQLAFLRLIQDLGRNDNAQFIVATQSPILLACPETTIYSFDHAPVRELSYEGTEHYRIYKRFMEDPSKYVGICEPGFRPDKR